ncbi:MAG: hypothetical protein ACJ71Z_06305 [Aeromicrobium sp.]
MIRTLIAIPYKVARAPLAIIDSTLAERLPETSLPRTTMDRLIGSSDKVVGALLGDSGLAERGVDRLERAHTLRQAGKFEHEADRKRDQAQQTVADAQEQAAQKRETAEERAAEALNVAEMAEARGEREARANAKKAAARRQAAADQQVANRVEMIDQQKQRVESAAEARKRTAEREAKAKIGEARKSDQSAAESRAQAEQLSDLVDAKERERKES